MTTLINLGCFQCTWIVVLLCAASGRFWPGAIALGVSIALQSTRLVRVKVPSPAILASAAAIGLAVDSVLVLAGCLNFPARAATGWPPPAWMSVLWINFATTLDESLAWAGERPLLAALAGAACGPLAYLAGQRAGAVHLEGGAGPLLVLACLWALAFPAVAALANSRRRQQVPAAAPELERGTP